LLAVRAYELFNRLDDEPRVSLREQLEKHVVTPGSSMKIIA
jgi:hypothetical protein